MLSVWNMCNIQIGTFATCVWNKWNILNNTSETLATCLWNTCNMCNIPNLLATSIWNNCNIPLKHLQYVQHPWSTFATSIWNNCNIPLKRPKHLKHTLATCASIATYLCWSRASRWLRHRSCVFFLEYPKKFRGSYVHKGLIFLFRPKLLKI
jgi:hypothetical protein